MKTTKIKFKIGEFSKLNRVTVKTLRHYEEIGLLVPSQVDKWTGYRYYDVCQLGRMNTIRYLKELGFTLEEIGELFDEGRTRPSPELIAAKTAECRETLLRLERRMTELERLGKELAKPKKMEKAFIKELPAVVVASHRRVVRGYDEVFDLCPMSSDRRWRGWVANVPNRATASRSTTPANSGNGTSTSNTAKR